MPGNNVIILTVVYQLKVSRLSPICSKEESSLFRHVGDSSKLGHNFFSEIKDFWPEHKHKIITLKVIKLGISLKTGKDRATLKFERIKLNFRCNFVIKLLSHNTIIVHISRCRLFYNMVCHID